MAGTTLIADFCFATPSHARDPQPTQVGRRGRQDAAGESAIMAAMNPVSDLEIYQRITAIADEFDLLTKRGASLIGGTALNTACRTLRGMAQAIYEHSLASSEDDGVPQ